MSSQLRQRKKPKSVAPEPPTYRPEHQSKADFEASLFIKIIIPPILFCVAILYFIAPKVFHDAFQAFMGYDDNEMTRMFPGTVRTEIVADIPKRDAVVQAFQHAWLAYERDAMGADEYHPISREGTNLTSAGGIGYTVVDSLDTMLLMGLDEEYTRARGWVATKMTFDRDASFNTFETTIRVLGGLLSAYHLAGNDTLYLKKAVDLAERILPAFNTPEGYPLTNINLARREGMIDPGFPEFVSSAEIATLQLEFRYLTLLTRNPIYWEKVEAVSVKCASKYRLNCSAGNAYNAQESHAAWFGFYLPQASFFLLALAPHWMLTLANSWHTGEFALSAVRLGSRADSYYEYLLSVALTLNRFHWSDRFAGSNISKLQNNTENFYREMYDNAMTAIHKTLIKRSVSSNMVYTSELIPEQNGKGDISWRLTPKQDHLVCFLGGSLMLGATTTGALVHPVSIPPRQHELSEQGKRDWKTGTSLVKTCMDTHDTATGLAPEIAHFRIASDGMGHDARFPSDWYIKGAHQRPDELPPYDARYILRPETIESLFIAYRLTGDEKYRNWAWRIFSAIETHCRVETGGYASIINVDEIPSRKEDKMETFMLSETLKYLYLIFSDESVLPLDKYVFNTEAHPLPIFSIPEGLMS
ncbi:Glycoside hydrolase family 47 protein [Mycena indigotica]|uniref:alpha-1,2-Mannosidase n=1 Tax=Mycena indigotica TaxID=2126181 RepID=A0A8H6SHF6_9AGAR|nr:Glycoside hydrolase family 47 protein [Mycena indigotica]KAF7298942.1 Glycoside hydrolase family 47 protein [Mycena indigotica]